jgi:hypothetical protein
LDGLVKSIAEDMQTNTSKIEHPQKNKEFMEQFREYLKAKVGKI